jgi:WD40 repeat protein/serine/threonine protein kinase
LADRLPGPEAETVEVHVEACAACQQMLEELTGTAGTGTVREPDGRVESGGDFLRRLEQAPPPLATPPGQEGRAGPAPCVPAGEAAAEGNPPTVAGYDVMGVLGRGGMGVVYKARHVRLNRLVALKVVLAGAHAGPDRLARFHVEATTAARLQHPHIVQIYEVGEQDGQPFLALEYVTGGSLAQRLDGTPQPPRTAAELIETLARAVQAAHQAGVVHRDLKPANVLLTEEGTPKLTDFGLAKRLDVDAGQTPSGTVLGTPSYMAPEQARGQARAIGPAADIYSLGAILYECLTGRPPFKAATTLDTVLQVMNNEPVPPRQLQPQAPRDLETVCLKCLHKEPGKRYPSAEALADDLRRFLRGEPVKARPVGSVGRAWRWCRRNPVVAGLLATVALSLLLGAGVSWLYALRAEEKAREATDNARRAYERGYVSDLRLAQRAWEDTYPDRLLELLQAQQPAQTGGVDLRGFEWYYWWRLSHSELLSLPGQYVCFSPVGDRLATVCEKTTVKIWDAATGQELLALPGAQPIQAVCFSPDGQRLAIAEAEQFKPGNLKVWDVSMSAEGRQAGSTEGRQAGGREVLDLKGSAGGVASLCFSPDGKWLAVGGGEDTQGGEVQVWDVRTGELLRLLRGHSRRVELVAFAADGKQLTSVSRGPLLRVRKDGLLVRMVPGPVELKRWDAATGKEVLSLQLANGYISALAFSPGDNPRALGQLVATSLRDNAVTIWEAGTGRQVRVLQGHTGRVTTVAFSPDGKHLVSGSEDRTLKVWDVATGQELVTIKGYPAALASVTYSPDGQRLAGASVDGTAKVWQATVSQQPRKLVQGSYVTGFAFSPAGLPAFSAPGETPQAMGLWLASAGSDKTIKLWDWATGKLLRTFSGLSYPASRLVLSPNRKVLAAATSGRSPLAIYPATRQRSVVLGEVKVWDAGTGEARPLEQPLLVASDLAISLDGNRLLAVGRKPGSNRAQPDDALHIWELATGKLQHRFPLPATPPLRVCFSRQVTQLATAGSDGVIRLFDTGTGEEIRHFAGLSEPYGVAFSADGQRLAGSAGERITVWEATTGRQLLTLKGHTAGVTSIAFSPDGRRLASAAHDNTVRIWEGKTGQELLALGEHREPGQAPGGDFPSLDGWFLLAFSPDGHSLALASTDGTIRIWDARPPEHP